MCPQPSLPVMPDDSAASRSSDRNEKPKTAKKPAIVLGPKKPTRKHALAPRPPDPVALQHPKRVDQKRTRCTKCGSKKHSTVKCVENLQKCTRCSDINNTRQCQIVVMRTRLMKTFRSRGDHRQVRSTLENLRRDGHRPAKETYTLLLSSLISDGRLGEGPLLLQQMEEDNVIPDAIFFNTLLNGYCEAGKMKEAEALVLEMKERGCPLITSSYNTLIKGYGLVGQPEEAMKLLQEMAKDVNSKPNDRTFNMLIKAWAHDKNPEKARNVISMMRAAGVGPDVVSYNTLAQLFAKLGKPWDAENVITEMQNVYLRPNERTYGIVINGYIAAGQIDESLRLIERMKMDGISPTIAVFNHLVKGYSEAMKPHKVDKVFKLMENFGVNPDVQTFGLIMNAWCSTGLIDEAKAALLRMKEYDLQPDVMAYSILVKGYSRQGRPEEGEAILKIMIDENLKPNVITYTTVISGYCSLAQMDDAMRVFQEMRSRSVFPNMQTFRTLIWGFKEARWPRRAEEILEYIRKAGFTPDLECIELVADCWRSIGADGEADRVFAGTNSKLIDDASQVSGKISRPSSSVLTNKTTKSQVNCGSPINTSVHSNTRGASSKLPRSFTWDGYRSSAHYHAAWLWARSGSSAKMRCTSSISSNGLCLSRQSSSKIGYVTSASSGLVGLTCRSPSNLELCTRNLRRVSGVVTQVGLQRPTLHTFVF